MKKRYLAHVEKITDVCDIPNTNNLCCCTVNGYHVVHLKEAVIREDLVVYFEVGSVVPQIEVFEFLRPYNFEVKEVEIRGVKSHGLILTLEEVGLKKSDVYKGKNLTKYLGITSIHDYKKVAKTRKLSSFWPSFIAKTDEVRIENIPWQLKDKSELQVSEKLDGTSATYFIRKHLGRYQFGVCSRNKIQKRQKQKIFLDKNIYWQMAAKYDLRYILTTILKRFDSKIVILQGEIVGNTQGNPYQLSENYLYCFNLIVDNTKINSCIAKKILSPFDILWVPIISDRYICPDTMKEFKEDAKGKSFLNPNVERAGCVYRDCKNEVSFKNINNSYKRGG